jgi:hypothetical protein
VGIANSASEAEGLQHGGPPRRSWVVGSAVLALALCLAIVASAWAVQQVRRASGQGAFAEDFATSVWNPGRAVVHGDSPMRVYTAEGHNGGTVYPPIATLATLPFSLPPYRVAVALWIAALLAAVVGSLWLCGVRDWRCYVAALLSPPVVAGVVYANVSILLVLAVALMWRWQDRPSRLSPLLGLVVAAKLFLWPLAVWLALTRRWLSLGLSLVLAVAFSIVGWAAIRFDDLRDYPGLMQRHAAENDQDGVSAAALAAQLGISPNQAVAMGVSLLALGVAAYVRRDELAAFTWCLSAAILASPMVWTHYYALLLVPLALAAPAWGPIWFVPYAFFPQTGDAAIGVAVTVALAAWIAMRSHRVSAIRTALT